MWNRAAAEQSVDDCPCAKQIGKWSKQALRCSVPEFDRSSVTSTAFQSVQLAGMSDRLPSGSTASNSRTPRRFTVPITGNARPSRIGLWAPPSATFSYFTARLYRASALEAAARSRAVTNRAVGGEDLIAEPFRLMGLSKALVRSFGETVLAKII